MNAKEIIQKHLEEMASKDASFSARYHDASKNMDECMRYIIQQAKKQAVNNAACIHSDEVFGLAVHYYQEESVKPTEAEVEAEVTAKPTAQKVEMKPKAQPKPTVDTKKAAKKAEKGKTETLELDLFA